MGDAGMIVRSAGSMAEKIMEIAHQENVNKRNIASQEKINQDNINFQKDVNQQQQQNWQTQFDYQKNLNNLQMQREDNAIQRSVKDHQAAGFNKLLAVGNQAASGGMQTFGGTANTQASQSQAAQVQAPSYEGFLSKVGEFLMQNKLNNAMISRSYAEANYTNQKTLTEIENTELTRQKRLREEYAKTTDIKQRELIEKQIEESIERIKIARHNLNVASTYNKPTGVDPTPSNPIEAAFTAGNAMAGQVGKGDEGKNDTIFFDAYKKKWCYRDKHGNNHYGGIGKVNKIAQKMRGAY